MYEAKHLKNEYKKSGSQHNMDLSSWCTLIIIFES